ncbi:hypothetical protein E4T44_04299, partial [Aureobasidium sp. EXF-8845]
VDKRTSLPDLYILNDDIVGISLHNSPSKATITTIVDSDQNKHIRHCFAPAEQAHNHGSDRARPLRTMPFDSDIWIGNFEDLGSRVWPHPSFKELVARSLTGNSKFALPDTVAKETRFQSLRLRCCGDGCDQTIHGPDVEYEKPSRLEMLPFGQTKNVSRPPDLFDSVNHADTTLEVIIYPFFVGMSGIGTPQKLFAIVHRHDTGYQFWKIDGTYHEFYGLAKGSASVSQTPRSARSINIGTLGSPKRQAMSTPTKTGKAAAQDVDDPDDTPLRVVQKMRALTRSRESKTQIASGHGEDPFADSPEPLSKRRNTGGSSAPSKTPTRQPQSRRPSTKEPIRSPLHIKEVCMLAYHVSGPALRLLYGNDSFTIESGEGSLMDPITESTFRLTAQHAQFVLYGREGSLKVILSKNSTRSIIESPTEITGGVILLDFGGRSARDEFIARVGEMVRGSITWNNDLGLESKYSKLLGQLNTRRTAIFDAQKGNPIKTEASTEQIQPLPAENGAKASGGEGEYCPRVVTETSSSHVSATPTALGSATLLAAPSSRESLQSNVSASVVTPPTLSQAVNVNAIAPPSSQAEDTTAVTQSQPTILTKEAAAKKELRDLLREMYVKYPSAQDDDQVESMVLLLKASLLAGEQERVRELKTELKISIRELVFSSLRAMVNSHAKLVFTCFSPVSDPGNHGADPSRSLQVAPFRSDGNSIWIGYANQPSRKYLGVFPSFDEVVDRCRRNAFAGGANTSFPRFRTEVRVGKGIVRDRNNPGGFLKCVCCSGCQDKPSGCEELKLSILPIETDDLKYSKVFLIVYKFYLRDEHMVALLHHAPHGKYRFQKTDGTLSKDLSVDSKHGCLSLSPRFATPLDNGANSDTSSLTEFDCMEEELTESVRKSPRMSLRSSQRQQHEEPATFVTRISPHPPQTPQLLLMPQGPPTQPIHRGSIVVDLTDEDEPLPIKQEQLEQEQPQQPHPKTLEPYKTPTQTPISTPSVEPNEENSFTRHFGPDPLAEEYGRITTQIFQEYSMRVFALPEVTQLIQRMKQAVKAGDRSALCRAYGALQAFLITVE